MSLFQSPFSPVYSPTPVHSQPFIHSDIDLPRGCFIRACDAIRIYNDGTFKHRIHQESFATYVVFVFTTETPLSITMTSKYTDTYRLFKDGDPLPTQAEHSTYTLSDDTHYEGKEASFDVNWHNKSTTKQAIVSFHFLFRDKATSFIEFQVDNT